jgi:hypothetical protein
MKPGFTVSARRAFFIFTVFLVVGGWLLPVEVSSKELLADTPGKLDSVVVSVNSARRSTLRNASLITSIVNALPDYTRISIITNDRDAFTVARSRMPGRVSFVELPDSNPITIWPQDPFLVIHDDKAGEYLLEPNAFERAGDAVMADEIAKSSGLKVVKSSLYFEGGNIVSDEKNIFIGANTIRQNAVDLELTEIEVVKRFEQELGRRVLVVGPFPQPSVHIDMFLTPLGNGRLVVADASQGADIMQQLIDSAPEKVSDFEKVCEQNFFGSPMISSLHVLDGETLVAPKLQGKTREMISLSREIAPILDGIADAFSGFGYQVYRMPFLFGGPEAVTPQETENGQIAAYPMLTYNNVLIEQNQQHHNVYLPIYGIDMMDDVATRFWQALGYKAIPIKGMAVSSMYGGALRCSTKVLKRSVE